MKRIGYCSALLTVMVSLCGFGALTKNEMDQIKLGIQNNPVFKDLPLTGDPGDITPLWESLKEFSNVSAWNIVRREQLAQQIRMKMFEELKSSNGVLTDAENQEQFKNPDLRKYAAARYCHLIYFFSRCYDVMGWNKQELASDFTATGWPDAGEYSWIANLQRCRAWLGAKPLDVGGPQPGSSMNGPMTGRSVEEIEAAIDRQRSYLRDLERKLDRASDEYSSYKSSERESSARGGRYHGNIISGKLNTVHNFERLVRENEALLRELEGELAAARMRDQQVKAAKEKSQSEPTASSPSVSSGDAAVAASVPAVVPTPTADGGTSFWKISTLVLLAFIAGGFVFGRGRAISLTSLIRRIRRAIKKLDDATRP